MLLKGEDMVLSDTQKEHALRLTSKLSDTFDEEETEAFSKGHTQKKWYHDFRLLFDMIRDKGYKITQKSYLLIAGALAYVVLPVDILPDMLLGVGFLDDAFVIKMVLGQLSEEIARYKAYRRIKST